MSYTHGNCPKKKKNSAKNPAAQILVQNFPEQPNSISYSIFNLPFLQAFYGVEQQHLPCHSHLPSPHQLLDCLKTREQQYLFQNQLPPKKSNKDQLKNCNIVVITQQNLKLLRNKINTKDELSYRSFFATKKNSEQHCQDHNHNGNKDANCNVGLLFSLFNEILHEKHNISASKTHQSSTKKTIIISFKMLPLTMIFEWCELRKGKSAILQRTSNIFFCNCSSKQVFRSISTERLI